IYMRPNEEQGRAARSSGWTATACPVFIGPGAPGGYWMSLRLEGERLQFKRLQGEGRARTVVEGSLELPAGRPPIGRGLRAWAKAVVQSVEPSDDRVLVEGVFHVSFLYAAQREDGDDEGRRPLGFSTDRVERVDWTAAVPFTYLLDVPGAREEG